MLILPIALLQLPPIATDRPDFTEGARTVPPNSTQLETGLTFTTDREWTIPEALVRTSVRKGLEARIGLPNFTANGAAQGIADPSLGLKVELNEGQPIDFAFLATATFAWGHRDTRSERTTPSFALAWAGEAFAGQLQSEFPGGPAQFRHTLVHGFDLDESTGAFIEHVLDFADGSRPAHTAHFGFTRALGRDAQIDLHAGIGLSKHAPARFVGAGYSFRF